MVFVLFYVSYIEAEDIPLIAITLQVFAFC